ncbi:MAG: carbohydrate kinase family protein, partial [Firmicutes bacterium]|nr:carbohydrate kinase family protein [Candidatus Colimorpha enterica]
MNNGIIVAGSLIVDKLKKIDIYPGSCSLTKIRKQSVSVGGLVNNCIQDLALIDSELPLKAVGLIGDDSEGKIILDTLGKYKNIDLSGIKAVGETSYTDVMYDSERRTRAYFQFEGSNADFGIEDIDFDSIKGDILHIGYILLLNKLDMSDEKYGTKMGELLHKAQSYGIKTSIDVVSEESDRYVTTVAPALKYVDYCIINELE